MNMPHLLVDITAHGYGHVSQTAPVVNELARRIPGLRVTLRSAAPPQLLRQRFTCDFKHIPVALDFGMQMSNAVDVEVEKSTAAYRAFHANWNAKVQQAAEQLRALQPDLLLANVPYLSLAAADVAGVRAAAMCCLNWADIYCHYCKRDADSAAIHAQMLAAYNSAEYFLKVQPAMPMPDLLNARSIGPIAQVGRNRRAQIDACVPPPPCTRRGQAVVVEPLKRQQPRTRGRAGEGVETPLSRCSTPILPFPLHPQGVGRGCKAAEAATTTLQGGTKASGADRLLGLKANVPAEKLILVAMGGIEFRLPLERWARLEGIRWLVPQAWGIARDDMTAFEPLGLRFGDLLASCDAVLTKPGYGTFAEAACAGVPVLYVSRRDWPEEPYLVQWLEQNDVCREVERSRLQSGDLEGALRDLWTQPKPPLPVASGAEEAAELLVGML
ncbi:MAG: hypothetical protein WA435_10675 [Gallionellaceae bacterium]